MDPSLVRLLVGALAGCVSLLAFVLGVGGRPASANPIQPGFDLFQTVSPGTSAVLPGIGLVNFRGVPLDPSLGSTDTIVQRTGSLPSGGTGLIPIELVALELMSTSPVNIGGSFFDLFAVINKGGLIPGLPQPDVLPPSTGTLTILSHNDVTGTGTFSSFFDVFVDIELTPVGGNPRIPGSIVASMPSGNEGPLSGNGIWSHTPPPGYPNNPSFPSGDFFPGLIVETGPMAMHTVRPATIPEPFSLSLLGIGAAALAAHTWWRQAIRRPVQRASSSWLPSES
jgi:hypothetical protein